MLETAALAAAAYLCGSIPFGLLMARAFGGADPRAAGSGNIGMTNVIRTAGKLPGALTFLLDFAKGLAPAALAARLVAEGALPAGAVAAVAVSAVVGHVFSAFLRFRGGKGISTTFGALAVVDLWAALACGAVWVGVFLWRRISSLSALAMLAALPPLLAGFGALRGEPLPPADLALFSGLAALLFFKHRDNIRRLVAGDEGRLDAKGK